MNIKTIFKHKYLQHVFAKLTMEVRIAILYLRIKYRVRYFAAKLSACLCLFYIFFSTG